MTETIAAPAHETVWSVTTAVVPACCLQLIAEIGVADRFQDPTTVAELAERCSVHPVALDRVLRLLVSHGIFERDGAVYRHNDASALLRSDNPRSMRAFARMMGLPVFAKTWGVLDHSLVSGWQLGAFGHICNPTSACAFDSMAELKILASSWSGSS